MNEQAEVFYTRGRDGENLTYRNKGDQIRESRQIHYLNGKPELLIQELEDACRDLIEPSLLTETVEYGAWTTEMRVVGWREATEEERERYQREKQRLQEEEERRIQQAEELLRRERPELFAKDND